MPNRKLVSGAYVPDSIARVLEDFASGHNTKITVAMGERESFPVSRARDRLTVVFYGYARLGQYSGGVQSFARNFRNYRLEENQSTTIAPSLISEQLRDKDFVYAEVAGNTLYILFDLLGGSDNHTNAAILRNILEEFSRLPSYEEREKIISMRIDDLVKKSWDNFTRFFTRKFSLKFEKEIRAQFEYIQKIAKGVVIVTEDEIRIDFGYVASKDRITGKKINIGQHVCVINVETANVLIFNHVQRDVQHPHVFDEDGWVCFGTINDGLRGFINDLEYANAVEGIRIFLAEADYDDIS